MNLRRKALSFLMSGFLISALVPTYAFGETLGDAESLSDVETAELDASIDGENDSSSSGLEEVDPLAVEYLYIESPKVSAEADQHIAIGFVDETIVCVAAELDIMQTETGYIRTLEVSNAIDGAALFTVEGGTLAPGVYRVNELRYRTQTDEVESVVRFADDSTAVYSFEVLGADEMPNAGNKGNDSEAENAVTVLAMNGEGEVVKDDDLAAAIDRAQIATAAPMMARSISDMDSKSGAFPLIVVLDPGHGGRDSGAAHNGILEKDINLRIAQYCKEELEQYGGVKVYMTRTADVDVALGDRVNFAVSVGADVVVSIHNNSSESASAHGAEVIVPREGSWYYSETYVAGTQLGEKILAQIVALGLDERYVYSRDCTSGDTYGDGTLMDYYTMISGPREHGIPGIIVEHAFVSNGSDASFLSNEANLRALGMADAKGIAQQYGLAKITRENAEAFVQRLYQKVLNRGAGSDEMEPHVAALLSGASAAGIAWNFFASSEFASRGLSNADIVETAYQTMLDRGSDPAGKADWTSKLDAGMSPAAIVSGFAASLEFRGLCERWGVVPGALAVDEARDVSYPVTSFASRLYSKVLGRAPDAGGLNAQCAALLSGASAAGIAWNFFASGEFASRGLSNADIVETAYQTMLDRGSDPAGKADWTSKLDAGMSPYLLVAGFANSFEFGSLCARYGMAAGPLPFDPAEIARYSNA